MGRLNWRGGEHEFALRIGELRALQERLDAGPAHVLERLSNGHWRVDDVVETIRLGLIGGGLPGPDAARLVRMHVEEHPLAPAVPVAAGILLMALVGEADDAPEPPGENAAGLNPSRAENGGSAESTVPAA